MKKLSSLVLVCFLVVLLAVFPVLAYSNWQPAASANDNLGALVLELRKAYELALTNRAASPDFLADLEKLVFSFEALTRPEGQSKTPTRTWAPAVNVLDPSMILAYKANVGTVYYVVVKGQDGDRVWGDGVYTYDSDLGMAAVHAGVLAVGQTDIVAVKMLPGQSEYKQTTRNGIASRSWGSYDHSYSFVDYDKSTLLIKSADLSLFEGLIGRTFAFQVTGSTNGGIWGSTVYTYDSDLGTAAVHAGLAKNGETVVVMVTIREGLSEYLASERNGVSSRSWGAYRFSFSLQNP